MICHLLKSLWGNSSSIPYVPQLGPGWAKLGQVGPQLGPSWTQLRPIWECYLGIVAHGVHFHWHSLELNALCLCASLLMFNLYLKCYNNLQQVPNCCSCTYILTLPCIGYLKLVYNQHAYLLLSKELTLHVYLT